MTITIADGRGALWQWDTGRRVKITDGDGVKQIHYQNRCFGCSVDVDVGDDGTAIIPDELLQDWHPLTVYAYVTDDAGGYTKVQLDFAVHKRAKPAGYVYTPTDQMTLQTIQRQIGDLADLTTEAKENLVDAINEAAASGGGSSDAVLYTPQTLTDAQKKQARENIDAASIDFVINGTLNDDDALTLDKTYTQIQEAVQAGKRVTLKVKVYGIDFVLSRIGENSLGYLFATAATVFPTVTMQFTAVVGASETAWHTEQVASYDSDGNLVQISMDRDPEQPMEIATKQYVDTNATGGTDMGITGATVGQIAKITAVDTDGVPTAWAPVDMPEALPNPNALTFTGAVTGSYDGSAPLSVEIPSGGGSGSDISLGLTGATVGQIAKITAVDDTGKPTAWSPAYMPTGGSESTFEKVVEMTTLEDAAVISISTDKNGNPLSMSEFYVAITTSRNSAATANGNFSCNVLPDTVPDYIRDTSAIKNVPLFPDVYCYVMHYKVMCGVIFHEFVGKARTCNGLNVAKYIENETSIGVITSSSSSNGTIGFLTPIKSATAVSKIDSAGKMYCITFGANRTACIFGAGTRVEVWAR